MLFRYVKTIVNERIYSLMERSRRCNKCVLPCSFDTVLISKTPAAF